MITRLKDIIQHLKRDALAGMVTGVVAIPLTVGICLMSDYPIMAGLYTGIFAGIISFITYLFKPGNYTGVPGVAAGLAPALALGINYFGMENMPFVILLTAGFQAIVWRFKLERFILLLVPHYLVEGLLAGVGLKIAAKFVPFLYEIEYETSTWLNDDRQAIIVLSIVTFAGFVLLYHYYKKTWPAMPYIVVMLTSAALSLYLPFPKVTLDSFPFRLNLPIPHFGGIAGQQPLFAVIKMAGFAMMLGTIDVIEQVMSHVAIEKIDPYNRPSNLNNSLLVVWISNLGATLFGGMTSLDGLAKSTTNTVAGAVTKVSTLFSALVILLVILFPQILTYLPKYALGIIMIYSGWRMIANLSKILSEGQYAFIIAIICGLLVYEFGIFEGMLVVLFIHAFIQYVFMIRVGKSQSEIFVHFQKLFSKDADIPQDVPMQSETPVFNKWLAAINQHDLETLMECFDEEAILIPAFSTRIRKKKKEIHNLYKDLFEKDDLYVNLKEVTTQMTHGLKVNNGQLELVWKSRGFTQHNLIRFSMALKDDKIITMHTSLLPDSTISISVPSTYEEGFIS